MNIVKLQSKLNSSVQVVQGVDFVFPRHKNNKNKNNNNKNNPHLTSRDVATLILMVPIEPWRNSTPIFGAVAFCTTKIDDFGALKYFWITIFFNGTFFLTQMFLTPYFSEPKMFKSSLFCNCQTPLRTCRPDPT